MYYKTLRTMMALMIGDLAKAGPIKRKIASFAMAMLPGQLSCGEFEQFICDYTENRLDPAVRRRFDFHMSVCPMCRTHLAAYLKTIELSNRAFAPERAGEPVEAPQELVNAVLAAIALSGKGAAKPGSGESP